MKRSLFKAPAPRFHSWPQVLAEPAYWRADEFMVASTALEHAAAYLLRRYVSRSPAGADDTAGLGRHIIMTGAVAGRSMQQAAHSRNGAPPKSGQASIDSSAVDSVLFTHMHAPQVSALRGTERSMLCLSGNAERPSGGFRSFPFDPLSFAARLEEFDFERAPEMAPLGPCIDVLGDGSLWAISTPGPTIGCVSYLVLTVGGPLLVAGLLAEALRSGEPAVAGRHKELGRFSLQRLRAFLDFYPAVRVAPGTGYESPTSRMVDGEEVTQGLFE